VQSLLGGWPLRERTARRRARTLLAAATAEILDCPDARLLGYYSPASGPRRGLVVLLHGWEGSAHSRYMLTTGALAHRHGFDVFRLNFRDHGDTHALNEDLFHSCRLDEVVQAVARITELHPAPKTVLIGYSLGGNFALRVAARARDAGLRLDRVIAICPVLCPRNTMRALENGLWIYRRHFLRKWRRSLLAKAAVFPDRYDFGDLTRFPTLTATTEFFVDRYTDFKSLNDYLDGYSITGDVLAGLDVPARLIAARDDPVIPSADIDRIARSPALDVTLAPAGGHCAFIENLRLGSWLDRQVLAELDAL
jgi:predicted alpha/beta-fold hydrolase